MNGFIPFVSHALFQELVPAVHAAIEDFKLQNASYKFPPTTYMIGGLVARVKDFLNSSKKGTFPFIPLCSFIFKNNFLGSSSVAVRPEKIKRIRNSVRVIVKTQLLILNPSVRLNVLVFLKRPLKILTRKVSTLFLQLLLQRRFDLLQTIFRLLPQTLFVLYFIRPLILLNGHSLLFSLPGLTNPPIF